jgi:hypothetical protein
MNGKIYLTNSPIVLANDEVMYKVTKISENTAFGILDEEGFVSAIGHQGTVDALKEIFPGLKNNITLNRMEIKEPSDQVVFKLKGRLPEGKILSLDEIKVIGYEFWNVMVINIPKPVVPKHVEEKVNDSIEYVGSGKHDSKNPHVPHYHHPGTEGYVKHGMD